MDQPVTALGLGFSTVRRDSEWPARRVLERIGGVTGDKVFCQARFPTWFLVHSQHFTPLIIHLSPRL